jgi:hypothetical protein
MSFFQILLLALGMYRVAAFQTISKSIVKVGYIYIGYIVGDSREVNKSVEQMGQLALKLFSMHV